MAGKVQQLAAAIARDYDNDASRIWTQAVDGPDLERRLLGLPGIGEMKAKSLIAILGKRLGVDLPGMDAVMPKHPTLGDVDSAEALADTRPASAPTRRRSARPRADAGHETTPVESRGRSPARRGCGQWPISQGRRSGSRPRAVSRRRSGRLPASASGPMKMIAARAAIAESMVMSVALPFRSSRTSPSERPELTLDLMCATLARMTDQSNSQFTSSGLKRQSMVTAAALVELIGPWADGADPLNEQLADALARAIEIGMLPAGTKLPAERELARELALSRTTIVAAYDRLRLAGLARSRQGSGTVSRPAVGAVRLHPDTSEDTDAEAPFRIARSSAGPEVPRTGSSSTMPTRSSSRSAPCLPARPSRTASRPHCATTCRHSSTRWATTRSGGPGSARGSRPTSLDWASHRPRPDPRHEWGPTGGPPHRLADRRTGHRGRAREPDIHRRDRCVPHDRQPPVAHAGRPDGPRVDMAGLLAASAPVRLAYVVPTFHNPTGATMPEARRRELARAAGEFGFQVVEDLTPDWTLGVDAPPPIAAFDPGDRVITIGSLSKLAWGGLRIGWIRAPRADIDRLVAGKIVADHATSLITQAIAAQVLDRIDEVVAGTVAAAAERRAIVHRPWPSGSRVDVDDAERRPVAVDHGSPMPTPCSSAGSPPGMASSSGPDPWRHRTAASVTTSGSRTARTPNGSSRASNGWRPHGPNTRLRHGG